MSKCEISNVLLAVGFNILSIAIGRRNDVMKLPET